MINHDVAKYFRDDEEQTGDNLKTESESIQKNERVAAILSNWGYQSVSTEVLEQCADIALKSEEQDVTVAAGLEGRIPADVPRIFPQDMDILRWEERKERYALERERAVVNAQWSIAMDNSNDLIKKLVEKSIEMAEPQQPLTFRDHLRAKWNELRSQGIASLVGEKSPKKADTAGRLQGEAILREVMPKGILYPLPTIDFDFSKLDAGENWQTVFVKKFPPQDSELLPFASDEGLRTRYMKGWLLDRGFVGEAIDRVAQRAAETQFTYAMRMADVVGANERVTDPTVKKQLEGYCFLALFFNIKPPINWERR